MAKTRDALSVEAGPARKGLQVRADEPLYVLAKDGRTNEVVVGSRAVEVGLGEDHGQLAHEVADGHLAALERAGFSVVVT